MGLRFGIDGLVGMLFGTIEVQKVARVVLGILMLPLGLRFGGNLECVTEIEFSMSLTCTSGVGIVTGLGLSLIHI